MSGNFFLMITVFFPILMGLSILVFLKESQARTIKMLATTTVLLNFSFQFVTFQATDSFVLAQVNQVLELSLRADRLAVYFTFLVGIMWVLVTIYSIEYMRHEDNKKVFYGFLLLTLGAMQGIGLADNLITFYLFYEMMTFMTYPLVIHAQTPAAKKAGLRYLAYSIFGAALSLTMIFIVSNYSSSFSFNLAGGTLDLASSDQANLLLLAFGIGVLGFGAKAGLYPLHAWLPEAHPLAPAPASALLSGMITKAGILGIIRTSYYIYGPEVIKGSRMQMLLIILSLLTILMGSILAYRSVELKVRLAYSSISQVSYIIFGLLLMNRWGFLAALLHIYFHSIIKHVLFMVAGSLRLKRGVRYAEDMLGIGKYMPWSLWFFTIVSLSLVGIPPLSGFISKYYLGLAALDIQTIGLGYIGIAVLMISSLLTFGYLIHLAIKAFFPGRDYNYDSVRSFEPSLLMNGPVFILTLATLVLGLMPQILTDYLSPIVSAIL